MKFAHLLIAGALCLSSSLSGGIIIYTANLSGLNESPPTASTATGFAEVDIDTVAQTMHLIVNFSGLTSNDTAAHIHCCVAPGGNTGVATTAPAFAGFPLGVTSGTYNQILSLTDSATYLPAFITNNGGTVAGAEATLLAGLAAGQAYLNIHTLNSPGGEIRGFLAVPEPGSFGLFALAIGGLLMLGRMRRLV